MAIEIIDKIKQKNNGQFPIVDSNDIQGGYYQVTTMSERDAIPEQRRKNGMLCYVENDATRQHVYQLENGRWVKPTFTATNAVYVGEHEPGDKSVLWVDSKDEDANAVLGDNQIINEFAKTVDRLNEKIKDIHYAFTKDLDAGEIPAPNTEEATISVNPNKKKSKRFSMADIKRAEAKKYGREITDEDEEGGIELPTYKSGNIECIRIKRTDKKVYLPRDLKDGELVYCRDTRQLIICDNGKYVVLGSVGSGGDDNTGTLPKPPSQSGNDGYIELLSPDNTKYRVIVNDSGILEVYDTSLDEIDLPTPDQSGRFAGLLVNQVYGGGAKDSNTTPVSHGFIELYNNTKDPIILNGLSVQVAVNMGEWNVLPLKGKIPAFSSFLIRCQRHSNEALTTTRCRVTDYDMDWDILLSDKGLKTCIMIGTEPISVPNPFNGGENATPIPGYIDMLSAGGTDVAYTIDGYEGRFGHYMDKYCSVQRNEYSGKKDSNDNMLNGRSIDYRTCEVEIYGPRHSKSGPWHVHYDKIGIDERRPNLLTIAYGQEPTTRIINWQAKPSRFGAVKYRKVGESKFISVPSEKVKIGFEDTDVDKHTVILRNLEPGATYEFQAGEEGKWSDLMDLVIDTFENNKPIRFLQVTDQQGWDEREYLPWKWSAEFIRNNENYDFIMNTGDIAQNGNRAFEWRYYYEFGKDLMAGKCHMSCIGNNDRIDKKDSTPFTWYTSYENAPYISCYSWDLGNIHFISLNSEELNAEQQAWFREDVAKTNKRWVIVYMHVAPYTIVKMSKVQDWRPVFEECGVDVVICGHHHAYSRSHPMLGEEINEERGVYYIMSNATGFKLSGKEAPLTPTPNWYAKAGYPGGPNYIMWEVTEERIQMTSYYIEGMLPYELYNGGPLTKQVYDTIEIPQRNLRG
ncbi:purple acid phosphatase family protein [Romboutsia ilealis]|uniref:purple acid phosphatase family protein n=1 Tax=Romboutsia ilealis TaxID=1115758 RepID=UPI00272D12DC|nr:metallophosphoesterase family protein [Romboutsia ilealis]